MLCKLCHLERALEKKKKKGKKRSPAPTITATFGGQIRPSENTRDSPQTVVEVGGAAALAAAVIYTASLETKTDSDVKLAVRVRCMSASYAV